MKKRTKAGILVLGLSLMGGGASLPFFVFSEVYNNKKIIKDAVNNIDYCQ